MSPSNFLEMRVGQQCHWKRDIWDVICKVALPQLGSGVGWLEYGRQVGHAGVRGGVLRVVACDSFLGLALQG